jgi:hypothetical protein
MFLGGQSSGPLVQQVIGSVVIEVNIKPAAVTSTVHKTCLVASQAASFMSWVLFQVFKTAVVLMALLPSKLYRN